MFDQYHVGKKLNKTLIEHNHFLDLVRLIRISTSYVLKSVKKLKNKTKKTYSCIVELNPNNCRTKNCWTSQRFPHWPQFNSCELRYQNLRPKIRTGGSFVCYMFDFKMFCFNNWKKIGIFNPKLLKQYSKYFLQMTFVKWDYSNNTWFMTLLK